VHPFGWAERRTSFSNADSRRRLPALSIIEAKISSRRDSGVLGVFPFEPFKSRRRRGRCGMSGGGLSVPPSAAQRVPGNSLAEPGAPWPDLRPEASALR
jgi:hypothetical protein